MKFVIAPDSYKGSLSAPEVGEAMARAIRDELPSAEVRLIPMADGGEGTVEALVRASGGRMAPLRITGPMGDRVDSQFGELGSPPGGTAAVEAGNTIGLPMVPADRRDPLNTTSRGLGEAILAAVERGYRRIVIGLGGSATNDGGLGLLIALGARYRLRSGDMALGFARELGQIQEADFGGLDPRLRDCRLTVASDVANPLLGAEGATRIYGPQKGVSPEQLQALDEAMGLFADATENALKLRARERPGAGAAGGLGFALMAVGAELVPGARIVAELAGLERHILEADWVLTGEGCSDDQTLYGKLPSYVSQIASAAGKPAILLSGSLGRNSERLQEHFAGCFAAVRAPATLESCIAEAERNVYECMRSIARLIRFADRQRVN